MTELPRAEEYFNTRMREKAAVLIRLICWDNRK
jgi:hypothetical protein